MVFNEFIWSFTENGRRVNDALLFLTGSRTSVNTTPTLVNATGGLGSRNQTRSRAIWGANWGSLRSAERYMVDTLISPERP